MRRFLAFLFGAGLTVGLAAQDYFPNLVFNRDQRAHDFTGRWYSKHLRALTEPSLFEASQRGTTGETYRFLWLPTWHHPISVRIVIKADGTSSVIAKTSDGAGGYQPGTLAKEMNTELTAAETKKLRELLLKIKFWELPSGPREDKFIVHDGATWIYEGVREGDYRIATKKSPKKGAYRDLGIFIISKSKVGIDTKDLY